MVPGRMVGVVECRERRCSRIPDFVRVENSAPRDGFSDDPMALETWSESPASRFRLSQLTSSRACTRKHRLTQSSRLFTSFILKIPPNNTSPAAPPLLTSTFRSSFQHHPTTEAPESAILDNIVHLCLPLSYSIFSFSFRLSSQNGTG